ncbi:MAG: hypothetical protein QOI36_1282 [Pseudonocardiales bacterium]|jgi:nucleotide-binding universal stress UspA family protein|nr:hypothetical protein [Pseudonocardiales bacterium]
MQAGGIQLLADVETAVRLAHPDLQIGVDLQTAGPIPTLIEQIDEAQLLVLGSPGTGGFRGILTGSTAVALVAHGRCPVAVIRGATPDALPPTEGLVVVGVDGSATSDAAIATAFDEASWRGAELVAVHAWLEYPRDRDPVHGDDAAWEAAAMESEREVVAERLAGWPEKYPDVTVRRVVIEGRPVERLLEHSVGAQLLVVGSCGRGGFTGMLLAVARRAAEATDTAGRVVQPAAGRAGQRPGSGQGQHRCQHQQSGLAHRHEHPQHEREHRRDQRDEQIGIGVVGGAEQRDSGASADGGDGHRR